MNLIVKEDPEALSQYVLCEITEGIRTGGDRFNFAPTGGSSPGRVYQRLAEHLHREPDLFKNTHFYTQDEVPYKGKPGGAIFNHLSRILFEPCGIAPNRIKAISPENYQQYDAQVAQEGGIDLLMLGLGADGHIAANLPGTDFHLMSHKIAVTEAIKPLIAKEVGGESWVPDHFISYGPRSILKAKKIVMLVNGENKAEILYQLFTAPMAPSLPATILRLHHNCVVVADKPAASKLAAELPLMA